MDTTDILSSRSSEVGETSWGTLPFFVAGNFSLDPLQREFIFPTIRKYGRSGQAQAASFGSWPAATSTTEKCQAAVVAPLLNLTSKRAMKARWLDAIFGFSPWVSCVGSSCLQTEEFNDCLACSIVSKKVWESATHGMLRWIPVAFAPAVLQRRECEEHRFTMIYQTTNTFLRMEQCIGNHLLLMLTNSVFTFL